LSRNANEIWNPICAIHGLSTPALCNLQNAAIPKTGHWGFTTIGRSDAAHFVALNRCTNTVETRPIWIEMTNTMGA
ncbi:hypothetical protein, partial [Mesorhizobium sp. B2-4-14]|uniref:hypothetical protein n=1 Tax=Mesorhizobium sp. B2-4-14 TaxID=2589935 RepID=UPI001AEF342A